MVKVPLAHMTTVLQRCPEVLSVAVYFYVVGVSACCLGYAAKSNHF